MPEVAIVVKLNIYRCVVHYVDCPYFKATYTHKNTEIPPTIKWHLCSFCKPQKHDIVSIASEIVWLEKYSDAMSFRAMSFDSDNEDIGYSGTTRGKRDHD